MKRNVTYLFLLLSFYTIPSFCLCGKIFGQESFSTLPGFRGIRWGTSMEEVRSKVNERYLQSFHGFGIDALSFQGKVSDLEARIDYSFKNNKLIEGSYILNPGTSFRRSFTKLREYLFDEFGNPDYRAGPLIETDSVWLKVTEYGEFKGPELYWSFTNGFIALIASKFEEKITITILFTNNRDIKDYGKDNLVPVENFLQ